MDSIDFDLKGVMPAVLLPFRSDGEIDEPGFRNHLADVGATKGLSALVVNGHSTEVSSCTLDERQRILDISMDTVGGKLPIVAGVYSESTREACSLARAAERSGASALLVFTPAPFSLGAAFRPEMTFAYYKEIASASALPLILFQFPMASGMGTPLSTLLKLAEEIPTLRAVKDSTNHPVAAEKQLRALHALPRPVNVLTTHSSWLLAAMAIGCDGVLSGAGSVIAQLHVELFEAMQRGDLHAARAVNERIYPISSAFYADPFLDMHNRMKHALVMLGRMKNPTVRPPLITPTAADLASVRDGLQRSGLLD